MSQKNMGRLAQDMKREVIAIIGRLKDPRLEGGLLTVTRLDVTPDLDVAKVYVSVMGREDGPKPAIEALNRAAGHGAFRRRSPAPVWLLPLPVPAAHPENSG